MLKPLCGSQQTVENSQRDGNTRPVSFLWDFPGGSDGKASCLQCRRPGFDPWVRNILWRRKWQPTPVLLPGKSHGQRSVVGYSPRGHKESDTTEQLHFTFTYLSSENLYAGQKATCRARHGTADWFKIGKGVRQSCILSPCLFNFYTECILWNAGLDESQAEIKISWRNINNLRYTDNTNLIAESEEEQKPPWWRWKRRVQKLA